MKKQLLTVVCAFLAGLIAAPAAQATNGMNLEGYGPIATGMGGASMAYDNGAAATMNNPATIGLMPDGDRLDVAFGYLGPHIKAETNGMPMAKSSADAFFMPALGWIRKEGTVSYGVGMFSQGGMGAEYGADSFLAAGSGDIVRSELGVGRVIVPLAYNVTPELIIGGSIDFVWASLDLKMAASVVQLGGLMTGCTGPLCGLGALPPANWARLDFSNGGSFSGAATGNGFAGKIGAVYKIAETFTLGATYHSKTSLDDLETEDQGAIISAQGAGPGTIGKLTVRDLEWPETYGIGAAWAATQELTIVADIKRINWSKVMKSFKMTYEGGSSVINFEMPQNWKDQTVYQIGAGYKITKETTLRAGANISRNPIPDLYLNPLFPATIEDHYTIGAGYLISSASSIDASFTYAPEVKSTIPGAPQITVSHYQTNTQVMYSYRF